VNIIVAKVQTGDPGFSSWQGQNIFSSEMFVLALGSTHLPIQWKMGVLSLG